VQVELSHFSLTWRAVPESEDGKETRGKLDREGNAGVGCVCHMPAGR
jgi:hypothetical protein